MTTLSGLQQILDMVNSATKQAIDANTQEKHRVTPQNLPGRQRVGPHVIEDDTTEITNQVQDIIQNKDKGAVRISNTEVFSPRNDTPMIYPPRRLQRKWYKNQQEHWEKV